MRLLQFYHSRMPETLGVKSASGKTLHVDLLVQAFERWEDRIVIINALEIDPDNPKISTPLDLVVEDRRLERFMKLENPRQEDWQDLIRDCEDYTRVFQASR